MRFAQLSTGISMRFAQLSTGISMRFAQLSTGISMRFAQLSTGISMRFAQLSTGPMRPRPISVLAGVGGLRKRGSLHGHLVRGRRGNSKRTGMINAGSLS
jgi:hypothetical protein